MNRGYLDEQCGSCLYYEDGYCTMYDMQTKREAEACKEFDMD